MHDLEIVKRLDHASADFKADVLGLHGVVQSGQHDGVDTWNGCDVHIVRSACSAAIVYMIGGVRGLDTVSCSGFAALQRSRPD